MKPHFQTREDVLDFFNGKTFSTVFTQPRHFPRNLWRIKNSGVNGQPELCAETLAVMLACNDLDIEVERVFSAFPMCADSYRMRADFLDGGLGSVTGNYMFSEKGAWVEGTRAVLLIALHLGLRVRRVWFQTRAITGVDYAALKRELKEAQQIAERETWIEVTPDLKYNELINGQKAYLYRVSTQWRRLGELTTAHFLDHISRSRDVFHAIRLFPKIDVGNDLEGLLISWVKIAPKDRNGVTGYYPHLQDKRGVDALEFLKWALEGRTAEVFAYLKQSKNIKAKQVVEHIERIAAWPIKPPRRLPKWGVLKPSSLYEWLIDEVGSLQVLS